MVWYGTGILLLLLLLLFGFISNLTITYNVLVTGYRLCSVVYSILRGYSPLARPLARGAGTSAVGCSVGRSRL